MKAGRSLFLILILMLLFYRTVALFPEEVKSQGEFRAILVGIDKYKKWGDGDNYADLSCCVNDITVFAEELKKNGYKVTIVKERVFEDGTVYSVDRKEIEARVKEVLYQSKPGDVVLVYFACHGVRIEGVNYLVPYDGHYIPDEKESNRQPITKEEYAKRLELLLPVETVYTWLSACPAKTKFILTDACQNNVMANVKKGEGEVRSTFQMDASQIPAGLIQITSCSPGETAKENPEEKHSTFMLALLSGLNDKADADNADKDNDGRTSVMELFDYVSKRVPEEAQKVKIRDNDKKQTPKMNIEALGGDIVFSVNRAKVESNELKAKATEKVEESRQKSKEEDREQLLTEASGLLDQAEKEYPGGEYTYLRDQIEKGRKTLTGRKAEELAAQAYEDYDKEEYQSGLTKIEAALKLQPNNLLYKQFRVIIKEKLEPVGPTTPAKANELLKEAYKLFEGGNRTEALRKVESALQLDPGNVGTVLLKRSLEGDSSQTGSTTASTSKLGEGQRAGEKKTLTIKGIAYTFCWCPSGSFTMGSPETEKDRREDEREHEVRLSRGFWLLESEVTQEMWESVMGSNSSRYKGSKHPVENVSWTDCQEFISKLNGQLSDLHMRLPSEAEWEYACRAGSTGSYGGSGDLDAMGWYVKNSGGKTHEVKTKEANAWGLYDMHGNVWEWCNDWYGEDYYEKSPTTDPTGPDSGSDRVIRGGSCHVSARSCRSAYRSRNDPGYRNSSLGFRLAASSAQ